MDNKRMACVRCIIVAMAVTRALIILVMPIPGLLMVPLQAQALEETIEIGSIDVLRQIGRHAAFPLSGAYRLVGDINAEETRDWDEGRGFEPIGSALAPFTGVFDGGGHTITGLTIYRPDTDGVGLFGYVGAEARLMNITLEACSVRGGCYTGGLVGENSGALSHCHVRGMVRGLDYIGVLAGTNAGQINVSSTSGTAEGREYVGGLAGANLDRAVIDRSGADAHVRGKEVVGGLAGANLHGRLLASHTEGRVTAGQYVGGLTGINFGFIADCRGANNVDGDLFAGGLVGVSIGKIVFCRASGEVRGKRTVGGLAGFTGDGFIVYCHASGNVTGIEQVGGLVGVLDDAGAIRACRADGNVTGSANVGGLIGNTSVNSTSLHRCYWGEPDEEGENIMTMESTVTESFATGDVSGDVCVGGLIGANLCNIVSHCYATGAVKGREKTGGLVGLNATPIVVFPAIIRRCYAVGHVSGNQETGGLIGSNDKGEITKSFWDIRATTQETSNGGVGIDTHTTRPSDTLQAHDWDFEQIWQSDNADKFPRLRIFKRSAPISWNVYIDGAPRISRQTIIPLDNTETAEKQSSWLQQVAIQVAEISEGQAQQEEIARLEALGYMIAGGSVPEAIGVVLHRAEHAWQGFNLYVSEHAPEVTLVDMDGRPLHRWRRSAEEIWPEDGYGPAGDFWSRAHVFDNGDLLVIRASRQIVKLDKDSNVLWHEDISAHHDFDISVSGDIYVLTADESTRATDNTSNRIQEDFVVVLDKDGNERKRASLLECFENSSAYRHMWTECHVKHGDIFHANALRVLDGNITGIAPEFQAGRVLTSLRQLNAIAVVDLDQVEVVWARRGPWRGQHDPRVLEHGALLLFDNCGRPGRSTVYEFDILTMKELWRYQGSENMPFYSETNGRAHRLPNGNTLIIESDAGRAFEVTPDKEIVWEFVNPHPLSEHDRSPALLFDVSRLSPDMPLHWAKSP